MSVLLGYDWNYTMAEYDNGFRKSQKYFPQSPCFSMYFRKSNTLEIYF